MKRIHWNKGRYHIVFILIFLLCFLPDRLPAETALNTRTESIEQALDLNNPEKSSLLKAFQGLSIQKVKEAYRESGPRTVAWLKEEKVSYSPFVESLLRVVMLFKMTADSPEKAMAILLPIFGLFFIISVIPFTYTALFVPPDMKNPQKPENDTITRRWFGHRKKSIEKPDNEAEDDDLSDSDVEEDEEAADEDEKEDAGTEEEQS